MSHALTITRSIFGRFQWRRARTRDQFAPRFRHSIVPASTAPRQRLLRSYTKLPPTIPVGTNVNITLFELVKSVNLDNNAVQLVLSVTEPRKRMLRRERRVCLPPTFLSTIHPTHLQSKTSMSTCSACFLPLQIARLVSFVIFTKQKERFCSDKTVSSSVERGTLDD